MSVRLTLLWKKFPDKIPKEGRRVLVVTDDLDFKYPIISTEYLTLEKDGLLYWESHDFDEVTYWAEIPNLPNDKEDIKYGS